MNIKQIKAIKGLLTAAGVVSVTMSLSGCAYFNVGEEEFSCSGMPGSVYCHSTRDVYEATNDGEVPSPMDKDGAYNENCTDCVKSPMDGGPAVVTVEEGSSGAGAAGGNHAAAAAGDEVINNYVTPALPERPVPIRTPSQVMRIWVAAYVDSNGDYNAPGYVFTEIEPRRWVLAKEYEEASRVFTPLAKTDMKTEGVQKELEGTNTLEELKAKTQAKAYK